MKKWETDMGMCYEISDEQSRRINILKLLLSIFVVYIHSGVGSISFSDGSIEKDFPMWFDYFSYTLSEVIPRCAVSGFFFMSSLLLYRKKFVWKDNMKKRLRTILIPYILFNLFWSLAYSFCHNIPMISNLFTDENDLFINFSFIRLLQFFGLGSLYPFLYPLWFLRNLFVLNVLACGIKKIIDFAPRISLLVICIVFLFVPVFPYDNFIFLLNPLDLCMWCFGYFCIKFKWDLNRFDKSIPILISFAFFIIFRIVTKDAVYPMSFLPFRVSLVISLIFWYGWFTKNENHRIQKLFLKYSGFSFGIYIFHELNISFAKRLVIKILGDNTGVLILEYLFLPVIIILMVIVLCTVMKKIVPALYSVLVGSRG